jgi:hypothetical protein
MAKYRRALARVFTNERAVGFLVWSGGRFLGGDVFADHNLFVTLGPAHLYSFVLPALSDRETVTATATVDVRKLLGSASGATLIRMPGADTGQEIQFETDGGLAGAALIATAGARPLHVSIFPR